VLLGIDYKGTKPVDTSDFLQIPARPPTLCAGCSHRVTFYAVNKGAERLDTICPTDIGCYTLGFLPPLTTDSTPRTASLRPDNHSAH
jgi:indolepyruvate ferredoxin oxidoreductase alpha subunit